MYVMLTLVGILPFLIAGQVIRLGIIDGAELRTSGENQSSTYIPVPALRGSILDKGGRALAVDVERYDLALDPTVPGFSENEGKHISTLSRLTGRSSSDVRRIIRNRKSPAYILLSRDIRLSAKEIEKANATPGLRLEPRFARFYNYNYTLSHVLGYVDADQRGLAGIEKYYDDVLRGLPGRRAARRDMRGNTKLVAGGVVVEPRHGESVVLSIDLVKQNILEEELARGVAEARAKWGTAIAMDPQTGEIIAMANVPTFDPNRPSAFDSPARRNHAITDRIEPGSTFKLIAAISSIETGIVSMEDSIDTAPGWIVRYGRRLSDTRPHGTITFSEVIFLSSNVGFALVTENLDPGKFYQYSRNIGFGQISGIDLPGEVTGRLKRPSVWSGTTLSAMSRGYEVEATPLQMLSAYAALANGGVLVRPHIVIERRDVMGNVTWKAGQDSIRRAFDVETARILLPAFEAVVNQGTAKSAVIDGLRIAGKTGTARKTKDGRYVGGAYRATFVGFYPVEKPEVAMIVIMDEPRSSIYGGSVSAPVFKRTTERWMGTLPSLADRFTIGDDPVTEMTRTIPDVTGLPGTLAKRRLQRSGVTSITARAVPKNAPIGTQKPVAGPWTGEQVNVVLTAVRGENHEPRVMPDMTGLSVREAVYLLDSHGIDVKIEGHGSVISQSPKAGASIKREVVLICD
ncbi:MAG: penicillin-binding transpeptidase domain-containing protein [Rhodothermia bacterium]|nr:MAG: penicillin-binding transpeptidase domain-containing protein [Rhodothermia bacterium]